MNKFVRLFLVAAAIFVAIMVIGWIVISSGSGSAQPSASTPAQPTPAPADVPVSDIQWPTVDAIYNLHSNETDLSKDDKWKAFVGKKVQWSGTVAAVSDSWGSLTLQVKMDEETAISDLIVTLDDSQRSRALQLRQGDPVTFTGILDSWGTILDISLKNGMIVTP
jgi:hypothetical protein